MEEIPINILTYHFQLLEERKKKKNFFFYSSEKKKEVKDQFIPNSYLFNWWIKAYSGSGSESWGATTSKPIDGSNR